VQRWVVVEACRPSPWTTAAGCVKGFFLDVVVAFAGNSKRKSTFVWIATKLNGPAQRSTSRIWTVPAVSCSSTTTATTNPVRARARAWTAPAAVKPSRSELNHVHPSRLYVPQVRSISLHPPGLGYPASLRPTLKRGGHELTFANGFLLPCGLALYPCV
jgi:hypothetical protein